MSPYIRAERSPAPHLVWGQGAYPLRFDSIRGIFQSLDDGFPRIGEAYNGGRLVLARLENQDRCRRRNAEECSTDHPPLVASQHVQHLRDRESIAGNGRSLEGHRRRVTVFRDLDRVALA